MPRNKKLRCIQDQPPVSVFKPAGVPARMLQRVTLRLDEYEALRLADYEGLQQEEVAERLAVSRPTVSRILESGRRTVVSAMVEGKALFIEGGPVTFGPPWQGGGRHGRGWHGGRNVDSTGRSDEMSAGRGRGPGGAGAGGGRGRGRMGGTAGGPVGECVCPSCGHKAPHERGVPCYQLKCAKCGTNMTRER